MMTQKEIQMEMDLAWKRIDDCIVKISDAAYEAKNNGKGNAYFVGKVIHEHVTYSDYLEGIETHDQLSIPRTYAMVAQLDYMLDELHHIPSWRMNSLLINLYQTATIQCILIKENLKDLEKLCNEVAQ